MACHVLIIEDELMLAMSLEVTLVDLGATSFDIVDCEADAITAARRHRPDLITSDVMLREGNGPHAIAAIHAELGDIPVIFVTGSPEDCKPCEPPGVIIAKPFTTDRLELAFRALMPR